MDLEYTQRIEIYIQTDDQLIQNAVTSYEEYLTSESLANSIALKLPEDKPKSEKKEWEIENKAVTIMVNPL